MSSYWVLAVRIITFFFSIICRLARVRFRVVMFCLGGSGTCGSGCRLIFCASSS